MIYGAIDHLNIDYRPIPDIVVAPVTRHFISLVGMLVGKNEKMATAMDGRRDLPATKTGTDSVDSDSHSTSGLCDFRSMRRFC